MKPPTVDELMVKVRHEMMKQFNASISTLKQSIDKKIVAAFESGVKALGIQHHADDLITSIVKSDQMQILYLYISLLYRFKRIIIG